MKKLNQMDKYELIGLIRWAKSEIAKYKEFIAKLRKELKQKRR